MDKQTASIDLAQLDKLRAEFETLVQGDANLARTEDGKYLAMATALKFSGFVLARRSLTSGAPAEPIYQVQYHSEKGTSAWHDASEAAYHTFMPERRRIVYAGVVHDAAAPSAPQAPVSSADCTRNEVDWGNGLTQLLESYKHAPDHGKFNREATQKRIIAYVLDVKAIEDIADELHLEASSYEGDFADTVNGCADALHHLVQQAGSAQPRAEGDERG